MQEGALVRLVSVQEELIPVVPGDRKQVSFVHLRVQQSHRLLSLYRTVTGIHA